MSEDVLLDWARNRPKPRAILCDIDEPQGRPPESREVSG